MGLISDIPLRTNGGSRTINPVKAEWWNIIRSKLLLLFGDGAIGQTTFTVANNQSSAADVTDLLFDSSETTSAIVEYEILRSDDDPTLAMQHGQVALRYDGTNWNIEDGSIFGDDAGVTFTVVAGTGQVQYTSTNYTGGSYSGVMKFKTMAMFNV